MDVDMFAELHKFLIFLALVIYIYDIFDEMSQ